MPRQIMGPIGRTVLAVALSTVLAAVLLVHRSASIDAERAVVFRASALSWSVSELMQEGLRFGYALERLDHHPGELSPTQLRFEILWSRHSVLDSTLFDEAIGVRAALDDFGVFLKASEEVMFLEGGPTQAQRTVLAQNLSVMIDAMRSAWMKEFNSRRFAGLARIAAPAEQQQFYLEVLIAVLVSLIVIYLSVEVLAASRSIARNIRLTEAAESASREKTRFLASISHEVRTPLNGILGMVQALQEERLTPDQSRSVAVIGDSGRLLLDTINDVLDLSKVENGELVFLQEDYDIADAVRRTTDLFRANALSKGLSFEVNVKTPPQTTCTGDPRRLRQVLGNLLGNAIKFCDAGHVTVDVHIPAGRRGIQISVTDTGCGIPRHAHPTIFDPFVQAESRSHQAAQGTGLGLAISRQIMTQMGGWLRLTSAVGEGSCFTAWAPLPLSRRAGEAQSKPAKGTALKAMTHLSVMAVDDNATNRMILQKLLGGHVPDLRLCASGAEALESFGERPAAIVLMDVEMPGMTGPETTEQLRFLPEGATAHVIAVTANLLPEQIESYLRGGMDLVLPKPVRKSALLDVITSFTQQRDVA